MWSECHHIRSVKIKNAKISVKQASHRGHLEELTWLYSWMPRLLGKSFYYVQLHHTDMRSACINGNMVWNMVGRKGHTQEQFEGERVACIQIQFPVALNQECRLFLTLLSFN